MSRFLRRLAAPLMFLLALPPAAGAECFGMNILDIMPAAERQAVEAAANAVPYPEGNFWTAEKGATRLIVIGTYHLDDPRHQATVDRLAPEIAGAAALLVEGGPEEEKALVAHMAENPSVMTITEGPTLLESLPEATWKRLSAAMSERGIPGFMAAKLQPWYVTVLLSVPPCAMEDLVDPKGLDGMLIDAALAAGVPVRALEPYDTVFKLFDSFSRAEQVDMIEQTLALEPSITDFSITLADAYFDGKGRLMWELMRHQSYAMEGYTRAQVDEEMARMEDVLMVQRNRAWIPVIEAAADAGPLVVVAFGALHLSGEDGVLNLLAENGWTVAPMVLP
ncbi:MAG: TraB/GumN family protein [Paracoccaceae bacterium]